MRTRLPILLALVLAAPLLTLLPAAPVAASSAGWLVRCPFTHSAADDPIKLPGLPGESHLHDFFGNPSTGAGSTYASMRAAATACGVAADTAGYWSPALYRNATKVTPAGGSTRQQIYYRRNNVADSLAVAPFPPDFRMIAGTATAATYEQARANGQKYGSEIYWGCSNNSTGKLQTPPASCGTGIITLHVGFPNCWDGVAAPGVEMVAAGHVRYPSGGACPAGFGTVLPRVIQRFEYPVGVATGTVTLASGNPFSAHADFWNTWEQGALDRLVARCLNGRVDCGTDPVP